MEQKFFVHPTADVSPQATIGDETKIWQHCQVREGAVIGRGCILSKGVYIDADVHIGDNVKIQNGISVYHGVTLEDGVFCGPHCVFTNDKQPRAINPDGTLKRADDWTLSETRVKVGASIGAHATIVCGVTIGRWAMIGSGAVVTRDVPDYGLVYGNPARLHGFVCACGEKLQVAGGDPAPLRFVLSTPLQGSAKGASRGQGAGSREPGSGIREEAGVMMVCPKCGTRVEIPARVYAQVT